MESNLSGSVTEQNLLEAWKAKSCSKAKYSFYAYTAVREGCGYRQIGEFFEESMKNESMHSKSFFMTMYGPVPNTAVNISSLLVQENSDAAVFPEYAKTAREEGFEEIALIFDAIAKVDAEQAKKYADILQKLENGNIFRKSEIQDWRCAMCGNVASGESAPDECPLCGGNRRFFEINGASHSVF